VGGLLASNASGPRRHRYGALRDQVIGLRLAHADGTLTRAGAKVVKNVTGYDMNKLYVGSLGTLGVILEASFRLYPLPADERTWLADFPAVARAGAAAARILDSPLAPSAVELLDGPAARETAAAALPEEPGPLLAVSLASVPEAVEAQLGALGALGAGARRTWVLAAEAQARFWEGVRDMRLRSRGCLLKVALLPARVPEALELAAGLAEQRGLRLRAVSEAGVGLVRCFLDAPPGGADPEGFAALIAALRAFAQRCRGSLVVLAAPPEVKAVADVWGAAGSAFPLMRELKRAFDPEGILNPGRFLGGL